MRVEKPVGPTEYHKLDLLIWLWFKPWKFAVFGTKQQVFLDVTIGFDPS